MDNTTNIVPSPSHPNPSTSTSTTTTATPPAATPPTTVSSRSGSTTLGSNGVTRRPKGGSAGGVERSCILCHRRKIRCDKRVPSCSTCTRTGVLCCYPSSSEVAVRKPRKTTIADVAERLVRLERTLVAISSEGATEGDGAAARERGGSSIANGSGSGSRSVSGRGATGGAERGTRDAGTAEGEGASVIDGFLLQNGEASRYMNEILISRVLEEEDELRSVLGAQEAVKQQDHQHDWEGDGFAPLDLGGLLSGYSPPCVNCLDLHPPKFQAMELWRVFVSYVDLFNKVLHVPTAELAVFKAIEDPASAPPDVCCLLFSVYFSAVTAMEDEAVVAMLGMGKRRALSRFRRGLEVSLVQADFLEAATLTALQAMGIFLQTIRAHNTGRAVWVLSGMVLRAAQSMGLHRDGKTLGLSIFETEMRRRLWWCVQANDGRVAEDHSITVNSHDPSTNIEFPLNVDDAQLFPSMTTYPETRGRWTEMSLPLIMKEHCLARRQLYQVSPPFAASVPSEAVRKEIVDGVMRHCEQAYFRYFDPVLPVQRAAMLMGRAVLAKLDFVSRLQWISMSESAGGRTKLATDDETLAEACRIIEYNFQITDDDLLRSYRWIVDIYPQYHVLLYVLWRLCVRPHGPDVERAWHLIERSFEVEFGRIGFENAPPGSKWTVLKAFKEKAAKIRKVAAESKSQPSTVPAGELLVGSSGHEDGAAVGTEAGFDWNLEDTDLPDWNELVEDFWLEECHLPL